MKLCFVCNEYPPGPHGGIGTFTQIAARGLVEAGHQVRVVGAYRREYPAPDEEVDQGVQVKRLRIPTHRFGWIRARYQLYRTIARWSRSDQIELVELHDAEGWAACWPRLRIPVIVRLHGSYSYFLHEMGKQPSRQLYWFERSSLQRANAWCSVSEYTATVTKKLFDLKAGPDAILYNPVIPPTGCDVVLRSKDEVVFTGTLVDKKGIVPLFKSWRTVNRRCPRATLHVYGKGGTLPGGRTTKEFLLSLLDSAQRESVRFYGHVSRDVLLAALSKARLAVFPSYAEAFALAPLEAMACGCPTVYSQRGSGPELIRHGTDGLLVDPDDVPQVASSIISLLQDDSLAAKLATAGKRRVLESFSLSQMIPKNEAFYQGCIDAYSFRRRIGESR